MWNSLVSDFLAKSSKPLIVVLGPTASGKTSLSIEIAKSLGDAEVVNADSRQLYKYLDIGTAKITDEEMDGVPHHLIDVLDPKEEATAGWYQVKAQECIDDILARGSVPLLVGGSMLYIASITDGLTMGPTPDQELHERLMNEYDQDEGKTLFARLQTIDPEAAEKTHRNNKPRIVRMMELYELTKLKKGESVTTEELRNSDASCPYDLLILGVERDREDRRERIDLRATQMFEGGWVEEVAALREKGYTVDDPGMKSHGYREIAAALENASTEEVKNDTDLQEQIAAKTRQYSRRQLTWWKGDSRIQWIQM